MQTETILYRGRTLKIKETDNRGWWWSHRQGCGFAPTRNEALAAAIAHGDTPKTIRTELVLDGAWEPGNFLPTVDLPTVIVSRKTQLVNGNEFFPGYIVGIIHPYGSHDSAPDFVERYRVAAAEQWDSEATNRAGNKGAIVYERPAKVDELVSELIVKAMTMREEFTVHDASVTSRWYDPNEELDLSLVSPEHAEQRLLAAKAAFETADAHLKVFNQQRYYEEPDQDDKDALAAYHSTREEWKKAIANWYAVSGEEDPLANIFND